MGLKSIKLLGVSVTTESKKTILEYIEKYLATTEKGKRKKEKGGTKPLIVVTPNPEQIVVAQEDPQFAQILNQADVAIPDGVGLVAAMRLLRRSSALHTPSFAVKRIPGVEFMEDLVRLAAERGYPIGLIGGRGGVAVEALECLKRRYPGLLGWADEPPVIPSDQLDSYDPYTVKISEKIRSTGTRLVFVGLGAPKQEYFMARLARQFEISRRRQSGYGASATNFKFQIVMMSVGGAFDMVAGRTPRAPFILRTVGLEWLWRLVGEPWRFRRQLALVKFLWLVIREEIKILA